MAGTGPLTPSLGCLSSASAEFTTNCWSGRRGDVTLALQHGHAEVGFKDTSHVSCGVCTQGGSLHGLRPQTPWHPGIPGTLAPWHAWPEPRGCAQKASSLSAHTICDCGQPRKTRQGTVAKHEAC